MWRVVHIFLCVEMVRYLEIILLNVSFSNCDFVACGFFFVCLFVCFYRRFGGHLANEILEYNQQLLTFLTNIMDEENDYLSITQRDSLVLESASEHTVEFQYSFLDPSSLFPYFLSFPPSSFFLNQILVCGFLLKDILVIFLFAQVSHDFQKEHLLHLR